MQLSSHHCWKHSGHLPVNRLQQTHWWRLSCACQGRFIRKFGDLPILTVTCAVLRKNRPENSLYTVILMSYQRHHGFNICICRMCHRHTTGEGHFFSPVPSLFLSVPRSLFLFQKKNHVILLIDNSQNQTPCTQAGQEGAVLTVEPHGAGLNNHHGIGTHSFRLPVGRINMLESECRWSSGERGA